MAIYYSSQSGTNFAGYSPYPQSYGQQNPPRFGQSGHPPPPPPPMAQQPVEGDFLAPFR